jgi:hypothetical protein
MAVGLCVSPLLQPTQKPDPDCSQSFRGSTLSERFVMLPFFCLFLLMHPNSAPDISCEFGDQTATATIDYCKQLSHDELYAYLESLGKRKRFKLLLQIYQSKIRYSSRALVVAAIEMNSQQAVALCKSFPLGSSGWQLAFHVLDCHPRSEVIGYIKEVASSGNPDLRSHCYLVCKKAGWADLVPEATKDLLLDTKSILPKTFWVQTHRDIASYYLTAIKRAKGN